MKKYFLLLALLLIAALAAVGLHPEVLDGYKKGMYADEISTSSNFFNEKIKTPALAALKGGPDSGMQSGGLTPEERAALENGDPDPEKTGTSTDGTSGIAKGGTDEPGKDPDAGTASDPDKDPDVAGTDPKDPPDSDPKAGSPDKDPDKAGDPDKTASATPGKGTGDDPEPGATDATGTTTKAGTTTDATATAGTDTPAKAPSGDAIKYVYDEFTAAGGVEFTGYSGVKSQNCWFNDVTGHFNMPNGSPEGGDFKVVIGTEELDCKDAKFTRVCLGYYLEIDEFPNATFTSASIKPIEGDNTYRVVGKLQVKDNTKPVAFDAVITQDEDEETATLNAEFKLDRHEFGLDYNGAAGYAISDEFSLKLELTGETE